LVRFQVIDDILDVTQTGEAGQKRRKDAAAQRRPIGGSPLEKSRKEPGSRAAKRRAFRPLLMRRRPGEIEDYYHRILRRGRSGHRLAAAAAAKKKPVPAPTPRGRPRYCALHSAGRRMQQASGPCSPEGELRQRKVGIDLGR
jgi:transposase InsO family protein